mgnify:CR=1 FL=1
MFLPNQVALSCRKAIISAILSKILPSSKAREQNEGQKKDPRGMDQKVIAGALHALIMTRVEVMVRRVSTGTDMPGADQPVH